VTSPLYVYKATLARVLDGDTFDFAVDLGFETTRVIRVRLRGLYAAEAGQPDGPAATARARAALDTATTILIQTTKTRQGRDIKSLDRYVADVWVDGTLLADVLAAPAAGVGA
jgi:endonuclease YncB( thermonuclease family)